MWGGIWGEIWDEEREQEEEEELFEAVRGRGGCGEVNMREENW